MTRLRPGTELAGSVPKVEAFESFVALAMEDEGLVVSSSVKFPVKRRTAKAMHEETQTHGFEVDLVAANANKLVLASVKSFFGSRGVVAEHVDGTGGEHTRLYAMLNDPDVRGQVVAGACERYGYTPDRLEMRLYVGRFAGPTRGVNEKGVRDWAATTIVGGGPIKVVGVADVVDIVRRLASSKQYRDDPALVALKVLDAAGHLREL
jgi:hypothetical protein